MSETTPTGRGPNRRSVLHYADNAVEVEGVTYPIAQLPEKVQHHFLLQGYAKHLLSKDDPAAAHAEAIKGDLRALAPKVEKTTSGRAVSKWTEAAANVSAEANVRAAGIMGKNVRTHPEFAAERARLMAAAEFWTKEQKAKVRAHPAVVTEYAKLTGAVHDVSSLFAPATQSAADDEAEAA